jgi:hypothetical protein
MSEIHLDLTESTIDGSGSQLWSLSRDDFAELAMHRIKQLGLTDAVPPYCRVRVRPTGSFVMVCPKSACPVNTPRIPLSHKKYLAGGGTSK